MFSAMVNEGNLAAAFRSMSKQRGTSVPPPAVVITLDSDPFQLDATASVRDAASKRHRDSLLAVGNSSSSATERNGAATRDSAAATPTESVILAARSRQNSLGIDRSMTASSTDLNHVESALAAEVARRQRSRLWCCCNENSRKVGLGFVMTLWIAVSWVGAAHLLKATFTKERRYDVQYNATEVLFDAPFFTTWLCASFNVLFFPIYLMGALVCGRPHMSCKAILIDVLQRFQEKQFSFSQFLSRCGLFCLMWLVVNLMLVVALRILDTTDVLALYASNVSFVYLLSWVVLHEQFVGIRIIAVILCNTGIALLAYMDGVARALTLGGVVLAAAAAALSGVYKVTFKKLIGDVTFGQLSLFFSLIGFLTIVIAWPIVLALYLVGFETMEWGHVPWSLLAGAGSLSLLSNLLGNFGIVWTFEIFLTLGLAFAVPLSAIADVYLYRIVFEGMKLAGILLILIGFMLVQLPEDWPDYLTLLLRYRRLRRKRLPPEPPDTTTGHRSGLRTPSGRVK